MGMASLSIASAIVASVGLTGGLVVYFNPGVVDYAREGTRRFGKSIDNSLGKRIRERVDGIKKRGPIVSEERQDAYGKLLGHAVGMKTREVSEQSHNSAEET